MPAAAATTAVTQPYIVVFREAAVAPAGSKLGSREIDEQRVSALVADISRRAAFAPANVFSTVLGGFSARLTPVQVATIGSDPSVASVTPDASVKLEESPRDGPLIAENQVSLSSPAVPAGIRRIGATHSETADIDGGGGRVDVDVAVIDTGIDSSHPDLNVAGGYNCTSDNRGAWQDGNGHGTHVAGTIGALDNGSGVVGVAPGARLWALKVLNNAGEGLVSWMVCGIDWITAKRAGDTRQPLIEVANMSLRANLPSGGDDHDCGRTIRDAMHAAICRSVAAGTVYVVAAGNDQNDASRYRPGTYSEAITVSAMTDYDGRPGGLGSRPFGCTGGYPDDTWAGFSNFGSDVDLIAPGVCVLSTWAGNRYAYASGTSMASPHVAGAAALYLVRFPGARPQQVRMALEHAARTDWKRSTDPDGNPDPIAWATDFGRPPDFAVATGSTGDVAGADSKVSVNVSIQRSNGHTAPVRLTLSGLPSSLGAGSVVTSGNSADISISVADWASSGRYTAKLTGDDGELTRSATIEFRIDTSAPIARFVAPAGSRMQSTKSARISWSEDDSGGSGLAGRTIWRQRARPIVPGVCTGLDYRNVGYAHTTFVAYTDSLYDGYCYRWQLTVRDGAGNTTTVYSGSVLVDTTAPSRPSASVAGSTSSVTPATGVRLPSAYVAGDGTLWLRGGGSGTVDLAVAATDSQSGIKSISLTPTTSTTGWTFPRSLSDDSAVAHLTYTARATALTLTIRATNGTGERGYSSTFRTVPDRTAPTSASWNGPSPGFWYSPDGTVTLSWTGGSDSGSGVSSLGVIRRQRAPVTSNGGCGSFANESDLLVLARGSRQTGLRSGYCYRWLLRTADRVGNLASSVSSGVVLVDTSAPNITIDKPAVGATIVKSRPSQTVSWSVTDRGGSRLASVKIQRQRSASHQAGSCAGATWKNDGLARTLTSPASETALVAGSCYRWVITATDKATHITTATSGSVLISGGTSASVPSPDSTAPSVSGLTVAPAPASSLTSTGMVWLDARWSATGGGATLTGHELRLSSSGGSTWDTFTTPNGATPYMSLRLPAGRTYLVEVRARNSEGQWSAWSSAHSFKVGLAQAETASSFETVGTWKSASLAGASGGAVSLSSSSGAIIRYSFTGRAVALVATTGPDRGRADVYVDGWRIATIDLYSATTSTREVVFTRTWSTSGSHIVSLQVRSGRVDLDAAMVLN